jgi:hypothetical protein
MDISRVELELKAALDTDSREYFTELPPGDILRYCTYAAFVGIEETAARIESMYMGLEGTICAACSGTGKSRFSKLPVTESRVRCKACSGLGET